MKHFFQLLLLSVSLFATPALWAEVVNINKATASALQENLKGIGEKKARAIVAYRKEHGAFKTLDEIMEVKGIGKGIFKKIKADISLGKGITDLMGTQPVKPTATGEAKKASVGVKKAASQSKPAVKSSAKKVVKPAKKDKKAQQGDKTKKDKVKKS